MRHRALALVHTLSRLVKTFIVAPIQVFYIIRYRLHNLSSVSLQASHLYCNGFLFLAVAYCFISRATDSKRTHTFHFQPPSYILHIYCRSGSVIPAGCVNIAGFISGLQILMNSTGSRSGFGLPVSKFDLCGREAYHDTFRI